MMGRSHAVSGAMLFAIAAPFLPPAMHMHLHQPDVLLGTAVCAGASLLPDLDHPDGTIANIAGPLSKALCRFVAWASGGHRHATHSLLFVALMWGGSWAGVHYWGRPFTLALAFCLLVLAVKATKLHLPGRGHDSWASVLGLALVGTLALDHWTSAGGWLPYAVGLGTLTHLLGDCMTKQGCPLFWPNKERWELGLIKRTGNKLETNVVTPLMAVTAVAMIGFTMFDPSVLT